MSTVADILEGKGSDVHRISAHATVFEAVKAMVDANVGSLLVGTGDEIEGIITERDYLRRVAVEGRTERGTLVREIMSNPVTTVGPESEITECMALMTEQRIRHAPVIDAEGRLVGMISIGDLVKFQVQQQSVQIRTLTEYITAR
jgi:CBS domain-containing protein